MEEPERSATPGIPSIFALDENDQEAVVEVDNLDDELEDDVDSETLRTRVCYVAQVLAFLVALIGLVIGLTIAYKKPEGKLFSLNGKLFSLDGKLFSLYDKLFSLTGKQSSPNSKLSLSLLVNCFHFPVNYFPPKVK